MVTVLLKKEIGNDVSFSSLFLEANVKMLGLILNHLRESVVCALIGFYKKSAACSN